MGALPHKNKKKTVKKKKQGENQAFSNICPSHFLKTLQKARGREAINDMQEQPCKQRWLFLQVISIADMVLVWDSSGRRLSKTTDLPDVLNQGTLS